MKTCRPLAILAATAVAGLGLTALATPASAETTVTIGGDWGDSNGPNITVNGINPATDGAPAFTASTLTVTNNADADIYLWSLSNSLSDDAGEACNKTTQTRCEVKAGVSEEFTVSETADTETVAIYQQAWFDNTDGGAWRLFPGFTVTAAPTPDPDPTPDSGSGGSSATPATVDVTLVQITSEALRTWASTATLGSWKQLPGSSDITGIDENAGKTFLGAATTPGFPVDIAQRQVDNGWGAYETFNEDGDLTSVFIPAGGWMAITNSTRLYAIWGD